MPGGEPAPRQLLVPERTVALILGAQDWPRAAHINGGPAFARSATDFRNYLLDADKGLGLKRRDVLDLFDSEQPASDQVDAIGDFLSGRELELSEAGDEGLLDVLVYYVGHGAFPEASNRLFILVRRSRPDRWDTTCVLVDSLARRVHMSVPFARQLVILDCCFSGAAAKAWMAGAGAQGSMLRATMEHEVPGHGAVLICSSASDMVSMCPAGATHTMFTGSLLAGLRKGSPKLGRTLSPVDARDLAWLDMQRNWGTAAVRPVLVPIDRGAGDFSRHGAFPNPLADDAPPAPVTPEPAAAPPQEVSSTSGPAPDGRLGTRSGRPLSGKIIAGVAALSAVATIAGFLLTPPNAPAPSPPAPDPPSPNPEKNIPREFLVFFDYQKASITPATARVLDDAVTYIKTSNYRQRIIVVGYSIDQEFGANGKNNQLARAVSVKNYLVQHGIPSEQIVAIASSDLEQPRRLEADRRAQVLLE